MGNNKWVHIAFFTGFLLLMFLVSQTMSWIWGYFARPKEMIVLPASLLIAGTVSFFAWRNQSLFEKLSEIVNELTKVTWPPRKETSAATVVVIITVAVFATILGVIDMLWSWATGVIYG